MTETELLIIGGGPAGLSAAIAAAEAGARVLVLERGPRAGGQLVKQTHMFFGSEKQHASVRGVDIPKLLFDRIDALGERIDIRTDTTALGIYEDGVVSAMHREDRYELYRPQAILVAAGATEKTLAFPNNDLPGIYGAGAVQTLMNVYGVMPGNTVLMVGAGNIGLIVSYQLMQAGVRVAAILDAAPRIGGYLVHAAKVRRMGVPILTGHTVLRAEGDGRLERAVIAAVNDRFAPVPGTEQTVEADVMCIAVGLSPMTELMQMAGCETAYIPELGGTVPLRGTDYQTTRRGLFVAGDSAGVEEASSAMVEGALSGLCAAAYCGHRADDYYERRAELETQLKSLRGGPAGRNINSGIARLMQAGGAHEH